MTNQKRLAPGSEPSRAVVSTNRITKVSQDSIKEKHRKDVVARTFSRFLPYAASIAQGDKCDFTVPTEDADFDLTLHVTAVRPRHRAGTGHPVGFIEQPNAVEITAKENLRENVAQRVLAAAGMLKSMPGQGPNASARLQGFVSGNDSYKRANELDQLIDQYLKGKSDFEFIGTVKEARNKAQRRKNKGKILELVFELVDEAVKIMIEAGEVGSGDSLAAVAAEIKTWPGFC